MVDNGKLGYTGGPTTVLTSRQVYHRGNLQAHSAEERVERVLEIENNEEERTGRAWDTCNLLGLWTQRYHIQTLTGNETFLLFCFVGNRLLFSLWCNQMRVPNQQNFLRKGNFELCYVKYFSCVSAWMAVTLKKILHPSASQTGPAVRLEDP